MYEPATNVAILEAVEDTPPPKTEYTLAMWDGGVGVPSQHLQLSRSEFILLKRHLALLRGLLSEEEARKNPEAV
ncbi:MAG: hypothetical protein WBY44_28765 [Bryobacteraceae bacterium]